MLFNEEEIDIICTALDLYADSESSEIRPALKQELIKTSLQKLSVLSPFTHFSKQEFSIMWFSMNHFILLGQKLNDDIDELAYRVCNRLADLALPTGH